VILVCLYAVGFRINCCQHKTDQTKIDLHKFFVMGGKKSLNDSEDSSVLYLGGKWLYNIHILEGNLLYMGKNKDPLCKCNNMQVIPSKGKEKVSCVQKVSLLQLSSFTLWREDIWEKAKTQIFTKCPIFSSA